jgi:hypothetical protein
MISSAMQQLVKAVVVRRRGGEPCSITADGCRE